MSHSSSDVLVLGLQGSGKTYLIQQLREMTRGKDVSKTFHDPISSGQNLDIVVYKKRVIKFKEIGGKLLLTWHRYYDDCKLVIVS
jgi:GTPase SAR1 family protein